MQTNDSLVACDSRMEWKCIYHHWYLCRYTTNYLSCDSIVTMDMTINYSIQTTDSLVACDSAEWNGTTYYTSGIYVDTLQTINFKLRCDSNK